MHPVPRGHVPGHGWQRRKVRLPEVPCGDVLRHGGGFDVAGLQGVQPWAVQQLRGVSGVRQLPRGDVDDHDRGCLCGCELDGEEEEEGCVLRWVGVK